MTPLPWIVLLILVIICIFHDMAITMVFSFAPKMIRTFGVSQADTGYYAGWLASSMYFGFLFCSLLWSYLGDKKGKKLSMLLSTTGLTLSMLAFGFSRNYTWAFVTRLLQGCSFGVLNVSKSYLYERLDDTNSALGIAILTSCGSVGFILGPSVAGYLVFPIEQYPDVFSKQSIFNTFPILLPYLIVFVCLSIGIILALIYLPNDKASRKKKSCTANNDNETGNEYSAMISSTENEIERCSSTNSPMTTTYFLQDNDETNSGKLSTKIRSVLKTRDCILSCISYGALGFSSIASNELFSLFASTATEYNGIGFKTSQIGTVLMIPSITLLAVQVPVLTKLSVYLGARKFFICSAYLQAAMIPLLPIIAMNQNRTLLWTCLFVHTFFLRLLISGSFLTVTILINNSCPQHLNAIANGIGFTFTAIGRLVAPVIFGSIYSWSLTNVRGYESNVHALGFPFNQFFSFLVLGASSLVIGLFGNTISSKADYKVQT